MKIGFLQYAPATGNVAGNLKKIKKLLGKTEADILVLPEMALTGYPTSTKEELLKVAKSINQDTIDYIVDLAKKSDACIILGMPEYIDGKVYNTTMSIGPKGIISKHQKSHLFMEEKKHFTEGTTKPHVFNWRGANIGVGVCYDYMFPEFWRKMGLVGVDLFCNTANFVSEYGFPVMRVRSIENGVFSITVNRVGSEDGTFYKGGSEIVDNRGNVLIKANDFEEKVYIREVNLDLAKDKIWNKINDLLEDRRPDLYK